MSSSGLKANDTLEISSLNDKQASDCISSNEKLVTALTTEDARPIDHKLERRICRKFDARILPTIAFMYLCNSLDKGNISNAKTNGLDDDIGLTGDQWNLVLCIFFVPYVLFALPLTYVSKKFNPANVLPCMMFGFGTMSLLSCSVFNFGSFMAARWFLGMCEAAFFPSIIYYLTTFYRRNELARRLAVFYAASNIANAFSGLLSYGVFQIVTHRLKGWQILFLIEGGMTVLFSFFAYWYLPRSTDSCSFLTPEETECAVWRIKSDSSSKSSSETSGSLREAAKILKHPLPYAWVLAEFCIVVPLNSVNNWFPQIIQNLGHGTVMTNLYTVAPNIWGAFALLVLSFSSDFARVRSIFFMIAVVVTLIGFAVFSTLDIHKHTGIAYFTCFLMTSGTSASSVLNSAWYNNNIPNENGRALMSALGIGFGNSAGLISTNIFRSKDAPKYTTALYITAAFGGAGCAIAICILLFQIYDNKRRNREQGVNWTYKDVPTNELDDGFYSPKFRWMY